MTSIYSQFRLLLAGKLQEKAKKNWSSLFRTTTKAEVLVFVRFHLTHMLRSSSKTEFLDDISFCLERQTSENVVHKPKTFWNVFSKVLTARIMGRFARKKGSVWKVPYMITPERMPAKGAKIIPYLGSRTSNWSDQTPSRFTYLYSTWLGVPPYPQATSRKYLVAQENQSTSFSQVYTSEFRSSTTC